MAEAEHGLKRLSVENWREPDLIYHGVYNGEIRPMNGDDWARLFLDTELNGSAPVEVKRLYNVARGCLLYGYFYHPLYAMGMEQILRAAEAAAKHKCRTLGRSRKQDRFVDMVRFLVANGAIDQQNENSWEAIRHFRNEASHPDDQMILPPGAVSNMFRAVTEQINCLFS